MIAALGNPEPFAEPRSEIELYIGGGKVTRKTPLGPNACRVADTGARFFGDTENRLGLGVASRFSAASVTEAQRRRTTRLQQRKLWKSVSGLQETCSASHAVHQRVEAALLRRPRRHNLEGTMCYFGCDEDKTRGWNRSLERASDTCSRDALVLINDRVRLNDASTRTGASATAGSGRWGANVPGTFKTSNSNYGHRPSTVEGACLPTPTLRIHSSFTQTGML